MTPSVSAIYKCLVDLVPVTTEALPAVALTGEERMAMAGSTSRVAPLLVRAVCRAMEEDPALFAGVPVDPGAVLERQDRAQAFFALFATLQRLTQRAHDCYLFEQAGATQAAMSVVRHGRHQKKGPFPSRQQRRLDDALLPAEAVLQGEQKRKERTRRRKAAP